MPKATYLMILEGDGTKANPLSCDFGNESELIEKACKFLAQFRTYEILPKKRNQENSEGVYTLKFDDEKIYFVE